MGCLSAEVPPIYAIPASSEFQMGPVPEFGVQTLPLGWNDDFSAVPGHLNGRTIFIPLSEEVLLLVCHFSLVPMPFPATSKRESSRDSS